MILDATLTAASAQTAPLGPQADRSATMPKHAAPPTVHDVIVAALATALPCPSCGSQRPCRCLRPDGYSETTERAKLVEAALVQHGHIHVEEPEPDDEQLARWLAARSRFPRYAVDDGWRKVLQSEADVEVAAAYAAKNASQSGLEDVARVKARLLSAVAERRAAEDATA